MTHKFIYESFIMSHCVNLPLKNYLHLALVV